MELLIALAVNGLVLVVVLVAVALFRVAARRDRSPFGRKVSREFFGDRANGPGPGRDPLEGILPGLDTYERRKRQ